MVYTKEQNNYTAQQKRFNLSMESLVSEKPLLVELTAGIIESQKPPHKKNVNLLSISTVLIDMTSANSPVLSLRDIVKRYHNHLAVDHVSLDVARGTIFGLLGPNGAGKTSLIRIITRITAADSGTIMLDGEPLHALHPSMIGYMPEERGLYKKMKVGEHLIYLAQLKGLTFREARKKVKYWLEKFDITDWWDKKIADLSKGMQQKIQFIATIIHEPKLIILDEPFSGLDPINANLIKDEIYQLKEKGASILFSTHRMEQVEEICEQIILINQGKKILDGSVTEIRKAYKENIFRVEYSGISPDMLSSNQLFEIKSSMTGMAVLQLKDGFTSADVLKSLLSTGMDIQHYNEVLPTLNEIFIKKVSQSNA
jgi:ABC-2 type transport system ATP-binding protein